MSRLPPNQESAPLLYIFASPAMNGPFPADLTLGRTQSVQVS